MKILFVKPATEKVNRAFSFPLGIMSIGTYLEKNGHTVKIIDRAICKKGDFKNELNDFAPDLVGLTLNSFRSFKDAKYLSETIRQYGLPVIWGGVFATTCSDDVLREEYVDMVSMGEGEETWLELAQWKEGKRTLETIKGMAYKKDGAVVYTPERPFMDLSMLTPTDFTLVDVPKYFQAFYDCKQAVYLYLAKGCIGQCTFCYNKKFNHQTYRRRPLEHLFAEVKYLKENYGCDGVYFADELFCRSNAEVKEIIPAFKNNMCGVKWGFQTRIGIIHQEDFQPLDDAGCRWIDFGIESGCPDTLRKIKKGIPFDLILPSLEWCSKTKITSLCNFIIGFPDESADSVKMTVEMAKKIKATQKSFFYYGPLPGAELYDQLVAQGKWTPPETLTDYKKVRYYNNPDPNFSKVPYKDLKVIRSYFLWGSFTGSYSYSSNSRMLLANKLITEMLKRVFSDNFFQSIGLLFSAASEFLNIFYYAHFFPAIRKKYELYK